MSGRPWMRSEIESVRRLMRNGLTYVQIAAEIGRSYAGVLWITRSQPDMPRPGQGRRRGRG